MHVVCHLPWVFWLCPHIGKCKVLLLVSKADSGFVDHKVPRVEVCVEESISGCICHPAFLLAGNGLPCLLGGPCPRGMRAWMLTCPGLSVQEEACRQAQEAAVELRGLLHLPLRGLLLERGLLHRLPPAVRLRAAHGLPLGPAHPRAGPLRAGLCPVL